MGGGLRFAFLTLLGLLPAEQVFEDGSKAVALEPFHHLAGPSVDAGGGGLCFSCCCNARCHLLLPSICLLVLGVQVLPHRLVCKPWMEGIRLWGGKWGLIESRSACIIMDRRH
jgi:hypothetical protein